MMVPWHFQQPGVSQVQVKHTHVTNTRNKAVAQPVDSANPAPHQEVQPDGSVLLHPHGAKLTMANDASHVHGDIQWRLQMANDASHGG